MEQYSYERRIVCFIDILGFSNIIRNTTNVINGNGELLKVCNALNRINDFRHIIEKINNKKHLENIQTTQFSDSIVISFPWRENDRSIIVAFTIIKYMQVILIKEYNILLRGGIVIGDVIHNDKLLVGPAMIDAYMLESKCAFSPRIIIDPKVAFRYNKILKKCKEDKVWEDTTVIHKDSDDTSYIDYFNFSETEDIIAADDQLEYFKQLCRLVATSVENKDMSIRVKFLWMRNKIKSSTLFKKAEYANAYKEIVTNKGKKTKDTSIKK
ncbi:MAG: hypothetical protein J6V98_06960 [Bacteroidales bacterium]|nr:hypothetical protein [Bacteroidales bacterium]